MQKLYDEKNARCMSGTKILIITLSEKMKERNATRIFIFSGEWSVFMQCNAVYEFCNAIEYNQSKRYFIAVLLLPLPSLAYVVFLHGFYFEVQLGRLLFPEVRSVYYMTITPRE